MVQSSVAEAAPRRGPGRPRHAETEPRAYAAALELFGRKGWTGLTLDGVAARAGIGKSSIYLRWDGKRHLLLEAVRDLATRVPAPRAEEDGVRGHLLAHARARAALLRSEHGPALVNLYSALVSDPACFAEICAEDVARGMRACASRVEEAVAGGELRAGTDVIALLDAIEGALLVHAVLGRRVGAGVAGGAGEADETYVECLVDQQLDGVRT